MATIIFDLDGTLIDTAPDLIATLNVVLGREGLPAVPEAEARMLIGHGAKRMLERGLTLAGLASSGSGKAVDIDRLSTGRLSIDRLFDEFIAYYADHLAD